jgi:hypothetical protein
MNSEPFSSLLQLLTRLKAAHIFYTLSDHTEGAIMVEVSVPGERWEIEIHGDNDIGVEVFVTKGRIEGAEAIEDLFRRFSD